MPSETRAGTKSRPVLVGSRVYVSFEDGKVYGLEAANGMTSAVWQVSAPGAISSVAFAKDGAAAHASSVVTNLRMRMPTPGRNGARASGAVP